MIKIPSPKTSRGISLGLLGVYSGFLFYEAGAWNDVGAIIATIIFVPAALVFFHFGEK